MKSTIYLDTTALAQLQINYPDCFDSLKESAKLHIETEATKYIKSKLNYQLSTFIQNSVLLRKSGYNLEIQPQIKENIDELINTHLNSILPEIIDQNIQYHCSTLLKSQISTHMCKVLNSQLDTLISNELTLLLNEESKG